MNAPSKLETLDVWWHGGEHSAAENLAFDQALLDQLDERPVLRFYQWQQRNSTPWTMGYFQRWAEMPLATGTEKSTSRDLDIARRWTGGGLVCHQGDFPYTLMVPSDHWLAKLSATDCYRWIHERLATSIREARGIAAVAQAAVPDEQSVSPTRACFAEPVHWDVTIAEDAEGSEGEKKIAGAAQRRSRGRLLHQGSVILPAPQGSIIEDSEAANLQWRQAFAKLLCDSPQENWSPNEQSLEHANELVRTRYGSQLWRERF